MNNIAADKGIFAVTHHICVLFIHKWAPYAHIGVTGHNLHVGNRIWLRWLLVI